MDIINKHLDKNVSECICVWIKELETCGFSTFFCNTKSLDTNTVADTINDNEVDEDQGPLFKVEDPFVEVQDHEILNIIREDGEDDNAGLIGHCTAVLHQGYELRYHFAHV